MIGKGVYVVVTDTGVYIVVKCIGMSVAVIGM